MASGGPPVGSQMGSYPPHCSSPGPPIMSGGGKPQMVSVRQNRINTFLIVLSAAPQHHPLSLLHEAFVHSTVNSDGHCSCVCRRCSPCPSSSLTAIVLSSPLYCWTSDYLYVALGGKACDPTDCMERNWFVNTHTHSFSDKLLTLCCIVNGVAS